MKKTDAIRIIYQAAQIYDAQLCNKRLLIIYNAPNAPNFIETVAAPSNFLHLTGVKLNNILAEDFFNAAYSKKLKESDFDFKDATTEQKLNVILQTLRISTNAKIIGDFNNVGLKLQTDKLAGSVYSCLGFIKTSDNSYVPNTVLEGDIRKKVNGHQRILAIISKHIDEPRYNEIKYVAKKIDIQKLLDKIKDDVPIDEKLFSWGSEGLSAPNVNKISYAPVSFSGGAAVLSPSIPAVDLHSFAEKVKENIGNITGKKLRQQYEKLIEELKLLKEQLFQKDKQIAKKDNQIAELIKANENVTAERDNLQKVCNHQKGVIKRTNLWINANPDVKQRMIQDKREQNSVFTLNPNNNLEPISATKQTHKTIDKKSIK